MKKKSKKYDYVDLKRAEQLKDMGLFPARTVEELARILHCNRTFLEKPKNKE